IAYLRLVAFGDDVSFKRIVNKPRRRFGRVKIQALQNLQTDLSLYDTLKENIENPAFKNSGAKEFIEIIDSLKRDAENLSVSETVENICVNSGYEKYIRELGDMERFENLTEFKRIATEYETNLGEPITLKEFINQISLQSEDEGEESSEKVKLMTIHAAKGLEFPNVFVIGFSEGVFPSSKTIEERKQLGLEEERRLCYVAITRAEKKLFLFDSEGFTQSGNQKLPSRFLREIGENNYTRIGTISRDLQAESDRFVRRQNGEVSETANIKNVGDRVSHPAFGSGVITQINKNNYRVKFDKLNSERVISADYFNKERSLPKIILSQTFKEKTLSANENTLSTDEKTKEIRQNTVPIAEKAANSETSSLQKALTAQLTRNEDDYKKVAEEKVSELKEVSPKPRKLQPGQMPEEKATPQIIKPNLTEYENLWNRPDVPKTGWICIGVTDLGAPAGVCQMCGHQIIRYVHHMKHPQYGFLDVGCICAGKMEGDIEKAKQRENDFKNKEARRESFMNRRWKESRNHNSYLKIKDHLIVLYYSERNKNWKYSLDNEFSVEVFQSREEAMNASFEALEEKLKK
ncbi:MAG: ATP-binding domain-containing protein, partial [Clostridia bacterium]|nr:ATP-binding domain-containing protein [Clostridia bacterium]